VNLLALFIELRHGMFWARYDEVCVKLHCIVVPGVSRQPGIHMDWRLTNIPAFYEWASRTGYWTPEQLRPVEAVVVLGMMEDAT